MKIAEVKTALKVGEILIDEKRYSGSRYVYYEHGLKINYDKNFPNETKTKQLSIVYFFVVNGVIYKIGQSSGKSGIAGCIGFFLKSGQDDPGINRFTISWKIREELKKGNKVELYMISQPGFAIKVPGLFGLKEVVAVSPSKAMEQRCIDDYKEKEEQYPKWNYQENAIPIEEDITKAFGQYKIDRKNK